ncbi:MAG: family 43 glycosylhydrolase [Deltaproteobacteria bacterium]|nr:family 43 glycosylhydrolase [Deltaproteobacteria bacterium]
MPAERQPLFNGNGGAAGRHWTADPSAHAFDCGLWVFPSHDQDNSNGVFDMIDYYAYELKTDGSWKEHGPIVALSKVSWAKEFAWAPDAAYKNGKYYFYFPAKNNSGIFQIGVAVADSPGGPYDIQSQPIDGSFSIDPTVFIDDDGSAYMAFGGKWGGQLECYATDSYNQGDCNPNDGSDGGSMDGTPRIAKLTDDMLQFDGGVKRIQISGGTAFFEGPWLHKYNDTYYLSYSTGPDHRILYATSNNVLGPYQYKGVVLPNMNKGWTTHHSIIEFQGKWYLFYHDDSCTGDDKMRCVKYTELTYGGDGSINTVNNY